MELSTIEMVIHPAEMLGKQNGRIRPSKSEAGFDMYELP
jgi:hypothetical protein